MSGDRADRLTRWWPLTFALCVSPCLVLLVVLAADEGLLPSTERELGNLRALESRVEGWRDAERRRLEVEREIAQLRAQNRELEAILPLTRQEAEDGAIRMLCAWGASDVRVDALRWVSRPAEHGGLVALEIGRLEVTIVSEGRSPLDVVAAVRDRPQLLSVRQVLWHDACDPGAPYGLDLEIYALNRDP